MGVLVDWSQENNLRIEWRDMVILIELLATLTRTHEQVQPELQRQNKRRVAQPLKRLSFGISSRWTRHARLVG
jgi:hypothetical protein